MGKVLVIGGLGFIGRNLAESLYNDKKEVFILDDQFLGKPDHIYM